METFNVNSFNLDSFMTIYDMADDEALSSFFKLTDDKYCRKAKVEIDEEYGDLFLLTSLLDERLTMKQKSGFFLGYRLESKIDEEFDLLRFSENSILNIELKHSLPKGGLNSIEDQLRRHKFILSITGKNIMSYTFVNHEEKIYKIDENDRFIETTFDDLASNIPNDYNRRNEMLDIDINKFIISPYSDENEFLNHEYYLSQDQKSKQIEVKNCKENKVFIKGHAGTGKSLLLFDLAKEFHKDGKNVILLFCGQLSNDYELTEKYGFEISSISTYKHSLLSESTWEDELKKADIIFIDEAQRIYAEQFRNLLKKFPDKRIYFAYDFKQILAPEEKGRFEQLLKENNENDMMSKFIELKQKIRTNKEMIAFIDRVLDLSVRGHDNYDYKDIDVTYFSDKNKASIFIESLVEENYTCIELTEYVTKSSYVTKRKHNYKDSCEVHNVIGREYEKVVVIIDEHFVYNNEGKLISNYLKYYPYSEPEGIYQALTRVKKNLYLVIINNSNVYQKVQQILTRRFDKAMEIE